MAANITTLRRSLIKWDSTYESGQIQCGLAAFDSDDVAYIGKVDGARSRDIADAQIESLLSPLADELIYPRLSANLTIAPRDLAVQTYIKRPSMTDFYFFKGEDGRALSQLREMLLDEARAMEIISTNPHANIVRYHGCRVTRGFITGIVLDHVDGDTLICLLDDKLGSIDVEPFMGALTSAVRRLHDLGLSHNDITPYNVMVKNGQPVLIDFGSCQRTGDRLKASRGSRGWAEDEDEYMLSKESHDLVGLQKIRKWMSEKLLSRPETSQKQSP